MAKIIVSNNFNAGELSKSLEDRTDYVARKDGARKLINVSPRATGGIYKRPGLQHVGSLGSPLFRRIHRWEGGEAESFGLAQSADGSWKFFGTEVTPSGAIPISDVSGFTPPGVTEETSVFTFGNVALVSDGNTPYQIDRSGVSNLNGTILVADVSTTTTDIINYGSIDYQPNANTNNVAVANEAYPHASSIDGTAPIFQNQHFSLGSIGDTATLLTVDDVFSRVIIGAHATDNNLFGYDSGGVGRAGFGSADFRRRSWRDIARTTTTFTRLATYGNGGVGVGPGTARYFNVNNQGADGMGVILFGASPTTGSFNPATTPGTGQYRLTFRPDNGEAPDVVVGTTQYFGFANQHHSIRFGTTAEMQNAFGTGTNVDTPGTWEVDRVNVVTLPAPNTDTSINLNLLLVQRNGFGTGRHSVSIQWVDGAFIGGVSRIKVTLPNGNTGEEFIFDATPGAIQRREIMNTATFDAVVAASALTATTPNQNITVQFEYDSSYNAENKTSNFTAIGGWRPDANTGWIACYFKGTERYIINPAGNGLVRDPRRLGPVAALYINSTLDTNPIDFLLRYRRNVLPLLRATPQTHNASNLNGAMIEGTVMLTPREITNPPVKFWGSVTEYNAEIARIGSQYGVNLTAGQKMKWNGTALVTEALADDDLQVPIGRYTMEWNNTDGWYRTTASRDSRIVHGGSETFPNKLWFSTAEKGNDFQKNHVGRSGDQRPIDAEVIPDFGFSRFIDGNDPIQNMYSGQSFQVFGRSGEYVMFGSLNAENLSNLEIRKYGSLGSRSSVGVVEIDEHTYFFTGDSAITLFYLSDEQGYKPYNLNTQYNETIFQSYWNDTVEATENNETRIQYTGLQPQRVIRLAGGNTGDINTGYRVYFLNDIGWLPTFHTDHKANNRQGFFAWSRYNFFQKQAISGSPGDAMTPSTERIEFEYNEEDYAPRDTAGVIIPDSVERKMIDIMTSNRQTILVDNYGELYRLNPEQFWDDTPVDTGKQVPIPIEVETASVQIVEVPEEGFVLPKTLQGAAFTFERIAGANTPGDENSLNTTFSISTGVLTSYDLKTSISDVNRVGNTPIVYENDNPVVYVDAGTHGQQELAATGNIGLGGDPVRIVIRSNTIYPWSLSRVDSFWEYTKNDVLSGRL